jgi:hypothetical protein
MCLRATINTELAGCQCNCPYDAFQADHLSAVTVGIWCTIWDDFRNYLMTQQCARVAQMAANLE